MDGLYSIPWLLVGYVVPFIVVLSLLVFVHEMGHYLAGAGLAFASLPFRSASALRSPALPTVTERAGKFRRFPWAAMCDSSATRTRRADLILTA